VLKLSRNIGILYTTLDKTAKAITFLNFWPWRRRQQAVPKHGDCLPVEMA